MLLKHLHNVNVHSVMSTLCDPMDCSPPGFSVHGILQARILEWVALPSSGASSGPGDWIHISCDSCIPKLGKMTPPCEIQLPRAPWTKVRRRWREGSGGDLWSYRVTVEKGVFRSSHPCPLPMLGSQQTHPKGLGPRPPPCGPRVQGCLEADGWALDWNFLQGWLCVCAPNLVGELVRGWGASEAFVIAELGLKHWSLYCLGLKSGS